MHPTTRGAHCGQTIKEDKRPSCQGGIEGATGWPDQQSVEDRRWLCAFTTGTETRSAVNFDRAVIKEQGATFGIMVVKPHVIDDATSRDGLVAQASRAFGGIPTVLMGQRHAQTRYYGRPDIVRFMAKVPISAVSWKRYRLESG